MEKRINKHRYLFVDAKNVVNYPRTDWKNYNKICNKPLIDLDEIFEYYEVPSQYRFLIIQINPIFSKFECQEYFTKAPFDYTGYTRIKKNENPKIIRGRAVLGHLSNIIEFVAPIVIKDINDVLKFKDNIMKDGLMLKYRAAVLAIFNIYFDYNNTSELNIYRKSKKK